MRHNIVLSVKLAYFEAVVTKLREAIPEVLLILQQEDGELARWGAAVWLWMLNSEPANDLALHKQGRLQRSQPW